MSATSALRRKEVTPPRQMLDLMLHIWEARARFPAWFDAAYYDGVTTARGHGSASSSLSAVRLGSGRNLCPPRFCVRRVSPSSVKCGARVWGTMTTDVYQQDEHNIVQRRKEEHESGIDLKQWMHEQGLPKCKVALAEHRPWEGDKGRPIHYVVASQDLQPGEVALTVPKELVVTLEKVLGDETIGMWRF